jgi:hypothetical protein
MTFCKLFQRVAGVDDQWESLDQQRPVDGVVVRDKGHVVACDFAASQATERRPAYWGCVFYESLELAAGAI